MEAQWTRKRWFCGHKVTGGWEVFSCLYTPQHSTHGHKYGFVEGPYKTRKSALAHYRG